MSQRKMGITDDGRIDAILKELEEKWKRSPCLRLGQIIVNVVNPSEPCPEVFYIEDERFYRKLKEW